MGCSNTSHSNVPQPIQWINRLLHTAKVACVFGSSHHTVVSTISGDVKSEKKTIWEMRMRDIGDDGRELLFWSEHGDWNRSSCHNDKRGWKGMRKKKERREEEEEDNQTNQSIIFQSYPFQRFNKYGINTYRLVLFVSILILIIFHSHTRLD